MATSFEMLLNVLVAKLREPLNLERVTEFEHVEIDVVKSETMVTTAFNRPFNEIIRPCAKSLVKLVVQAELLLLVDPVEEALEEEALEAEDQEVELLDDWLVELLEASLTDFMVDALPHDVHGTAVVLW